MTSLPPSYSRFYLDEGLPAEPKQYFKKVAVLVGNFVHQRKLSLLDVGCANGWFIHYLSGLYPNLDYSGIDIFKSFIEQARKNAPNARFQISSMLDAKNESEEKFDVITALGVMQILDDEQVPKLFEFLFNRIKPRGRIYVFAPFNEYGIDVVLKYRHRLEGSVSGWSPGGNAYSFETLSELISSRCIGHEVHPFDIGMRLERGEDPRRGWTIETNKTHYQMTNGLKLLMDQYIVEIRT